MKDEKKFWRFIAVVILAAWVIVLISNILIFWPPVLKESPFPKLFIFELVLYAVTIVSFSFLIISPLHFELYFILLCLWGFYTAFYQQVILSILLFILSIPAAWRKHWVRIENKKRTMLFIIVVLFIPCFTIFFVSKSSDNYEILFSRISALILMLVLGYAFLEPSFVRKRRPAEMTIDARKLELSKREARILAAVLKAEKYETIASSENVSCPWIKKCMKNICSKLDVSDRTELLATYSGCTVIGF